MRPRHLLFVDDDDDIRTIGEMSLTLGTGWQITLARSGNEALVAAAHDPPDLILLDVMMPDLDGPATLLRLKSDPSTAAIPIVFLTARIQPHQVDEYLQMGAIGVIAKPFDPLGLADEIRSLASWN